MIKDYLEIGQIVSTHGVRGEMRLNPWCDGPEFASKFKTLYFTADGQEPVKVIACRPHGNIAILKLEGVETVEQASALRNRVLWFRRADARLPRGNWFIGELIGCDVIDADDESKVYGTLTDVAQTGANDVWYVTDPDGKEVLIPAIKDVVKRCDVENNRVYIKPLRGLFDCED